MDLLVWIGAGTRQSIVAGYARAGIEVLGADSDEPEQAARVFLAWLEPKAGQDPCRWLVVLDDLADPADLSGGLWPPNGYGRTLVTTRRREAALTGQGRHMVNVGTFMPREGDAYLTGVLAAHGRGEPADEIAALAADLGHLPLALAQAAAYLIDAAITCADYRRLLADRRRKLADLLPEPDALPDAQTATVQATWSLSIEHADRLRPGLARPMLQLSAMLNPNGIPVDVLTSDPALSYLAGHRPSGDTGECQGQQADVTVDEAISVLRALHRLSLIDHSPDTPHEAVRVHQVVQRVVRDALALDERDGLARTAADALAAVWPVVENDALLAQALRTNADALTTQARDALWQPVAHEVHFRSGRSLGESGQAIAATQHFRHLTLQSGQHFGSDHPDTLNFRSQYAYWQGEMGDAAGAAAAFAELLTDQLRVLGADHPDTLTTRNELAYSRGEAGDAAGAAGAFAELLTDRLRILGPDHIDTLATRSRLAYWRGEAGDAAAAATAFAQLLTDRLRLLGANHPRTLNTRSQLARWQGEAGDAAGAAAGFAELLTDRLRILGPDHPRTLTTRHNLAHWQGEKGDAAEAATAFAELLTDQLRVLGADHPDTLTTRNELAYWREEAEDTSQSPSPSQRRRHRSPSPPFRGTR
ncbi:tetratricopeptide repeat protein [Streptomyces sp. NBC_01261]|uniref:tetratricopeptide repeat protein n=1 Tax=Streptomyces sp. NBC_01261 TaxID=2903802 RepID=UPI002E308D93|nr:tetratricopeptide repeat protein [Streptomyces sp. NBC_01261]